MRGVYYSIALLALFSGEFHTVNYTSHKYISFLGNSSSPIWVAGYMQEWARTGWCSPTQHAMTIGMIIMDVDGAR